MGIIKDTITIYERLCEKDYRITLETGSSFLLRFDKKHYHHLAGYHYLTDLVGIAAPPYGKARFYRHLKNNKLPEAQITQSMLFPLIAERMTAFGEIEKILSASDCKIIVAFNKNKAGSDIEAKFFLYHRNGNPLRGSVTYYSLFIGYDPLGDTYYPATYLVEHSTKYVRGQVLLNCKIEQTPRA